MEGIKASKASGDAHHQDDQRTWMITPADPTKPCPFTSLPTEIREMIYEYSLPPHVRIGGPPFLGYICTQGSDHFLSLLQVSQRVRHEAAFIIYGLTTFKFQIKNCDFTTIKMWMLSLPIAHRRILDRNKGLVIEFLDELYSDENDLAEEHDQTELCHVVLPFLVGVFPGHDYYPCNLVDWFLWRAEFARGVSWIHKYECEGGCWASFLAYGDFTDSIGSVCANNAAVDAEQKTAIKEATLGMIRDCELCNHTCEFTRYNSHPWEDDPSDDDLSKGEQYGRHWVQQLPKLKRLVEEW